MEKLGFWYSLDVEIVLNPRKHPLGHVCVKTQFSAVFCILGHVCEVDFHLSLHKADAFV